MTFFEDSCGSYAPRIVNTFCSLPIPPFFPIIFSQAIAVAEFLRKEKFMDKEKIIHEIAIAYLLYRSSCENPDSPEDFYQDYLRAVDEFTKISKHY